MLTFIKKQTESITNTVQSSLNEDKLKTIFKPALKILDFEDSDDSNKNREENEAHVSDEIQNICSKS